MVGINTLPVFPHYVTKAARLKSFIDWPLSRCQSPEQLADAGFVYTGCDDKTVCFYCGGGLKDWEAEDVPWLEHLRWFSRCPYVYLKFNKKCSFYVDKAKNVFEK